MGESEPRRARSGRSEGRPNGKEDRGMSVRGRGRRRGARKLQSPVFPGNIRFVDFLVDGRTSSEDFIAPLKIYVRGKFKDRSARAGIYRQRGPRSADLSRIIYTYARYIDPGVSRREFFPLFERRPLFSIFHSVIAVIVTGTASRTRRPMARYRHARPTG